MGLAGATDMVIVVGKERRGQVETGLEGLKGRKAWMIDGKQDRKPRTAPVLLMVPCRLDDRNKTSSFTTRMARRGSPTMPFLHLLMLYKTLCLCQADRTSPCSPLGKRFTSVSLLPIRLKSASSLKKLLVAAHHAGVALVLVLCASDLPIINFFTTLPRIYWPFPPGVMRAG